MRLTQDVQVDKRRDLRHIDYVLRKPYADAADCYVMHSSKLGSGQFGVIRPCLEISTGRLRLQVHPQEVYQGTVLYCLHVS